MAKTDADFENDIIRGLGTCAGLTDTGVLTRLAVAVNQCNDRWWHDANGERLETRNYGELMALVHSEISESLEGNRKNLRDKHLPEYPNQDVELVDAIIRILDILGQRKVDVDAILWEKMIYNANRTDHKLSHRATENGKAY